MESQEPIRRLSNSARYRALARRRRRVVWLLTGVAIIQYSLYFLVIAWAPGLAGTVWPAGGSVSVIIWLTVAVILLSVVISAGYVWWAGRYHDPEREALIREAGLTHE